MAAAIQHAHQLLDQLGPGQLAAVVPLLETMVSPEEDGDALSDAERKAVAERRRKRGQSHFPAGLPVSPSTVNFFAILQVLQKRVGVRLTVQAA